MRSSNRPELELELAEGPGPLLSDI
jgi:hypothetical protein